jgi:hypothetical protein
MQNGQDLCAAFVDVSTSSLGGIGVLYPAFSLKCEQIVVDFADRDEQADMLGYRPIFEISQKPCQRKY